MRYRYDTEIGLYYLNSRYYNQEWGRFINADSLGGKTGELLSHNMFAYALYNPVNMEDQSGYLPSWIKGIGNIVSGVISVVSAVGAMAAATTPIGAVLAIGMFAYGVMNAGTGIVQTVAGLSGVADKKVSDLNPVKSAFTTLAGEKYGTRAYGIVDLTATAYGPVKGIARTYKSSKNAISAVNRALSKEIKPENIIKPVNILNGLEKYNSGRNLVDSLKDAGLINNNSHQKIIPIFDPDISK
ncbi:RHS repeat-associated core domain-containing protein [Clostridium sp.]|uniref:RHS repeat-associated core domain-containing protein n=1 Tax=Clostridium sp. TaxID=1506 RepID=UPI002FC998AF